MLMSTPTTAAVFLALALTFAVMAMTRLTATMLVCLFALVASAFFYT